MDTMLACPTMTQEAVNTEALAHRHASDCPNCGASVSGNFCHQCGQETVLHPPSTGEFVHEFIGHYVALEGKLWQTLKLLILRPGKLTLEYLAGRRVRYIQPLRVYLTFSLIFFALFKFMGEDHHIGGVNIEATPVIQVDPQDRAPKVKDAISTELGKDPDLQKASQDHAGIKKFVETLVEGVTRDNGKTFKTTFFGYVPYAVFALMPVFALYLKLLYFRSGRRYGEHLLFALHTNAFAYLMLAILLLLPDGIPFVGTLLFMWLAFYLPLAMRRVYGGGRFVTFVRWCVLMFLHLLSVTAVIVAVLYSAVAH
jgi:hypothetical protein